MATEPDNHEPNELFNAFSEAFDGYCVGLFELDAVRAALGRVLELELTSIGAATSLIHKAFQEDIIKARTYEALINDIDLAASEEDPTEWSEDTRSEIEQEKACANAVFDNTNPDLEDELETPEPKLPSSPSIEIIYTDLPPPDDSDGPSSDNTATETENKAEKSLTLGPGSILADRYELVSLIGNGSMGDIYEAIDRESQASGIEDPRVAIKVISQSFSKHSNALATLQYEADNSRKMVHQNIVSVLGADWDEDRFFMIMELLEGQSLGSMLTEAGSQPLPHPQARDIIASLCHGLQYAHQRGIVHADIKPGNIFVLNDGTAKLIDFGAATGHAITEATPIQGAHTPAYASCEVIEGAKPTIQDDVFSMACVIYRILAGHRAFGTCNALEAERNKLEPARLRFLPSKQWKALRKALAFRRKQRTQTVSEFLRAFTPPQTQWEQRPKSRYRPNLKAGLSAVAAIIAAVAIILLWPDSEPQPVVGSLPGQQQLMHQSMPEQTIFEEMEEPVPIVETTENQTVPLQNELINNTDNGEVSTASEAPDAEDMDTPEPEALPTAEAEPALDRLELRIAELVTSADDAMNNGQLLEPAEDNASAYITALNVLTPEDARTVQLKQRLADLMLLEAMVAVSDEEFDKADDWITEAKTLGLSQAKADRFDNELLKARETKANRQSQQFDTIFASASPAAILSDPPANKAISDNFMDFSDEPDGSPAMVAFALSGAANNGATGQVADTQAEAADNQPPEISNEISMSELEFETFAEPQYPRRASIRKLSGAVEVRFRINTNGKTDDIRVISSEPPGRFNKAAITAVNKWRFKPVLENGVATEKYSSVRFSFKP